MYTRRTNIARNALWIVPALALGAMACKEDAAGGNTNGVMTGGFGGAGAIAGMIAGTSGVGGMLGVTGGTSGAGVTGGTSGVGVTGGTSGVGVTGGAGGMTGGMSGMTGGAGGVTGGAGGMTGGSSGMTGGSSGMTGGMSAMMGPATFTQVYDIIEESCGGGTFGCHVMGESGSMELHNQMQAFMNLVGVASEECDGETRVIAGDADNSLIIKALEGTTDCLDQMPDGRDPLSADQIAIIRSWIDDGAKNN